MTTNTGATMHNISDLLGYKVTYFWNTGKGATGYLRRFEGGTYGIQGHVFADKGGNLSDQVSSFQVDFTDKEKIVDYTLAWENS